MSIALETKVANLERALAALEARVSLLERAPQPAAKTLSLPKDTGNAGKSR